MARLELGSRGLGDGDLFVAPARRPAGPDLFVANSFANSVTELDTSTGVLVRVLSGAKYHFEDPVALVLNAGDLFVLSSGGSVAELDSVNGRAGEGGLGTRLSAQGQADAMILDGNDLFVAGGRSGLAPGTLVGGAITEVNTSTGGLVKVVSGPSYQFADADAMVLDRNDLFVANGGPGLFSGTSAGGSVTELNLR